MAEANSKGTSPKKNSPKSPKKDESGKPTQEADDGLVSTTEWFRKLVLSSSKEKEQPEQRLPSVSLDGIIEYIKSKKCKNIVTMAGAGISTSAGIPDFRSPGTGLYDNLQKYNLPTPQAIFDIGYFKENPEPFFMLAKKLWPGTFKPTPCHYFIRLLQEHDLLLRHYTQNIDTLERVAGVHGDKIVEAHGTFHTSHCLRCDAIYSQDWIKERIFSDMIPTCTEKGCDGVVKPDVVFFGEALPQRFAKLVQEDLPKCDLLIVLGTSLAVQPFASLPSRVPDTTPRLVINLEKPAGGCDPFMALFGMGAGFAFDKEDNYRDVFSQSTCDDGCREFATKLGWKDGLEDLIRTEHAKIDMKLASEGLSKGGKKESKEKSSPSKV